MSVLTFTLDTADIKKSVDREVSKVAARTRNEGVLMYDILKIYESDGQLVTNALEDSIRSLISQFSDIATGNGTSSISFDVPDFDTTNQTALSNEISRYLAVRTVADWFMTRLPDMAPYFATLASESLGRVTTMLRQRKRVTR